MEILYKESEDTKKLAQYLQSLAQGIRSSENVKKYEEVLARVDAFTVNDAIDSVLQNVTDIDSYKIPVARFIRSCAESLDNQKLPEYPKSSILYTYAKKNTAISAYLSDIQLCSKGISDKSHTFLQLKDKLENFSLIQNYYIELQNDLFPQFEKSSPRHRCVSLMWAIQDDTVALYKKLYEETLSCLSMKEASPLFWKLMGSFFVTAQSLAYRERYILFPTVFRYLGHLRNEKEKFIGSPTVVTYP